MKIKFILVSLNNNNPANEKFKSMELLEIQFNISATKWIIQAKISQLWPIQFVQEICQLK